MGRERDMTPEQQIVAQFHRTIEGYTTAVNDLVIALGLLQEQITAEFAELRELVAGRNGDG